MKIYFDTTESGIMNLKNSLEETSRLHKILDWKDNVYESYNTFISELNSASNELNSFFSEIKEIERNLSQIEESTDIQNQIDSLKD